MNILIQCEYKLDESEIEEMLLLWLKNKKQITEFIKNNLDVSVLDNNLSNGDVLDVFYTKAEEGLFEWNTR